MKFLSLHPYPSWINLIGCKYTCGASDFSNIPFPMSPPSLSPFRPNKNNPLMTRRDGWAFQHVWHCLWQSVADWSHAKLLWKDASHMDLYAHILLPALLLVQNWWYIEGFWVSYGRSWTFCRNNNISTGPIYNCFKTVCQVENAQHSALLCTTAKAFPLSFRTF